MVSEAEFWSRVEKGDGCWLWTGPRHGDGYGMYGRLLTHRLVWVFSNGPIPSGLHVLHSCDNPPCVRPSHLFLGTNLDNVRDAQAKGRFPVNQKVTPEQVRAIYADQRSRREIAEQYGVAKQTVGDIKLGYSWSHVTGATPR